MCASLLLASDIFGVALGSKKRTILTTKKDFIFKGLPRAGFKWFAIIAISCAGFFLQAVPQRRRLSGTWFLGPKNEAVIWFNFLVLFFVLPIKI